MNAPRSPTLAGRLVASAEFRLREATHMMQRAWSARRHRRELHPVQDNTGRIGSGDILLFCCLRDEAVRIPFFLDYYRALGVRHFLFVDNGSTDGFMDHVRDQGDVSVWYTEASYRRANFGMHWLNALLHRYGCEHWCVTCDPDEFLVFPHCDARNLEDLAAHLDSEERRSLCCVMLDMYSDRPLAATVYRAGDDPFAIAPWFDGTGYTQQPGWLRDVFTQGGVRRRLFFRDIPEQAPALNKTPFVKWRWSYHYFLSMHQLVPALLNQPHAETHTSTTGCLMHFKYFQRLQDKVTEELERKEHWNDSFEYRRYGDQLERTERPFIHEGSERYRDWRQLVALGLMSRGRWF